MLYIRVPGEKETLLCENLIIHANISLKYAHTWGPSCRLYNQAYTNLGKVTVTEGNVHEVKAVAGFISYKISQLQFRKHLPTPAIQQFKRHVESYADKVGPPGLVFQHSAWMSQQ